MRIVYLDNAATTPVRTEVLGEMLPFLSDETFGNPSSAHRVGRRARQAVEHARDRIAAAVGASPGDVVFTSGGTEADNLAIIGGALAAQSRGARFHVAVSAVEHPAVMEAAETVERLGGMTTLLPVGKDGRVLADALAAALEAGAALVSVMWVNNEAGFVQDIPDIAGMVSEAGAVFHTDAVQAVGKVPCALDALPCPLLSISGHKIGAPQGVGALIVRDRQLVEPLVHGGGQQQGVRPGTENVAGIVGLGCAVELAVREVGDVPATFGALRDDFERRVLRAVSGSVVNGASGNRAPHISNIAIPGVDTQALLMHLDMEGIAASAGSACHTGTAEPSKVLTALGVPAELAARSLRFSFFKQNTQADVDAALGTLPGAVERVRALAESLHR
jgi:cysteine desulfurase